jgi:plasmid replication initiation protein
LREVFLNSNVFARLKMNVMLSFSGKYGLTLYEMIEKRINMRKTEMTMSIMQFRGLLGVPKGKLTTWNNLKTRAIDPAVAEVNQLATDFRVEITGLKTGRSFTDVLIRWWRTAPDGEEAAIVEHLHSKVGRKVRREGKVEEVEIAVPQLWHLLTDQALETARTILLQGKNRVGLQTAISQWEQAFANKERPNNPNGAFIGFCKKIA